MVKLTNLVEINFINLNNILEMINSTSKIVKTKISDFECKELETCLNNLINKFLNNFANEITTFPFEEFSFKVWDVFFE